ncbi:hypothetical protein NMY22_g19264 [Coprinellus aureogranulatus]|nr:hypothetical protein NMY22_g19264 [Coprinellus aureogranulatus]
MAFNLTPASRTRLVPLPPVRDPLPPPHHAQHRSLRALRELIDNALAQCSVDSHTQLRAFLQGNEDLELVSTILNVFLVHNVPSSAWAALSSSLHVLHIQYAIGSLLDVLTIIRALLVEPLCPPEVLLTRYLADLLGPWPKILQWLNMIVDLAPVSSTDIDMLTLCTDLMATLTCIPVYEGLAEELRLVTQELIEMPATIDLFIRLFTYSKPERGVRFLHLSGNTGCKLISTLTNYMMVPHAFASLVGRIMQKRSGYIHAVLECIVQRAVNIKDIVNRSILGHAVDTLRPLAMSLNLLMTCATKLTEVTAVKKLLVKMHFAYTLCKTLSEVCDMVHEYQAQNSRSASASKMESFWVEAMGGIVWVIEHMLLGSNLNPLKILPSILEGTLH